MRFVCPSIRLPICIISVKLKISPTNLQRNLKMTQASQTTRLQRPQNPMQQKLRTSLLAMILLKEINREHENLVFFLFFFFCLI